MRGIVLDCLMNDLTAYNIGLLSLHLDYRYWAEELAIVPGIIQARQIEDIPERVTAAIRNLEKEIGHG